MNPVAQVVLQTPTPTPGVGPGGLADYGPSLVRVGWFFVGLVVTLFVGWFVVEPAVSRAVRRRNRNNPTIQEAISRYTRLLVVVVAVFVAAGTAGYGRFLTDSAVIIAAGTLALGVAGQAVIGSLISGLVLVVDPEFSVGNYIEWDDGEGEVQSITLRITRVVTPDGGLATIPNTVLTSGTVTRPYGRKQYRVVEHVGVAYEADAGAALDHLRAAAEELDHVIADPPPDAYLDELGDDEVVVRVHYWVDHPRPEDVFTVRSRYARAAKSRLEAADIEISPASEHELQGRIEVADGE